MNFVFRSVSLHQRPSRKRVSRICSISCLFLEGQWVFLEGEGIKKNKVSNLSKMLQVCRFITSKSMFEVLAKISLFYPFQAPFKKLLAIFSTIVTKTH